jgi:PAS domain S-box-containing protein
VSTIRLEKSLRSIPKQRADERLFAEAFEHAPNGMAVLDAHGRFIEANHTLCSLLGFTRDELLGLPSIAVTHPEDAETETEQRRRLAAGEINRYQLIQRFMRRDGESTWVRLSVSASRPDAASPEYYVVQVESAAPDPTTADDEAHDSWLARVGDATLSAVHEIGNTLTPLMLNTQMIVEQSKRDDISDSAQEIFKAARRIAFTLRRLRGITDVQPVAYLGQDRMLDLRLVAPPKDEEPPQDP